MAQITVPRVASIGLGKWGKNLANAARRTGALEIATCFARGESSRAVFADEFGCQTADSFEAILGDPAIDGLLIATPHSTHAEQIIAAAEAGKHVFVEKPLSLNVAEAAAATDAAAQAGVALSVGYQRRRGSGMRQMRAMLDAGELGVLHQLEGNISTPRNQMAGDAATDWRFVAEENSVGGMASLGVHVLDNFMYLAGPLKEVFVYSKRIFGRNDVDDATVIAMELESGPLAYLGTSFVVPNLMNTTALGTGAVAWSEEDNSRFFVQRNGETVRSEIELEPIDDLGYQMEEFAACIRGETVPECDGAGSIEIAAVLEAVRESVASHQAVSVAPYRPEGFAWQRDG